MNVVTLGVSEGRTSEGDQTPEFAVLWDPIPGQGKGPSPDASQVSSQAVPAGRDHGRHPSPGTRERSRAVEKVALQAERQGLGVVLPL